MVKRRQRKRKIGEALLTGALFFACVPCAFAWAGPFEQNSGSDGIVSVEAEHYAARTTSATHQWATYTNAGYSGEGAFIASPNTGANVDVGYTTNSPRLDYRIKFVKTGTHYVWIRGIGATGNDDSFHAGLDGQGSTTSDRISYFLTTWSWTKQTMDNSLPATINVTTPGEHTLNIWMREDGSVLDKIVLTTNSSYAPSGTGPVESVRALNQPPTVDAGFDQTVTLPSDAVQLRPLTYDDGYPTPPGALSFLWTKVSGPAAVVFGNEMAAITTAQISSAGSYVIRLTISDGEFQASDDVGVTVNPQPDTTPPNVILTSPLLVNTPSYTLTYTVDGESFSETVALSEGANAIARTFTDASGNRTDVNWSVVLDTVAPQVVLSSSLLTNNQSYQLNYTVDGQPVSESLQLIEGPNQIARNFTDTALNRTDVNWVVTLDTISPSGTLLINGGSETTNNPLVALTVSAIDNGSGVSQSRYSSDQGLSWSAWENYASTRQLTLPSGDGVKEARCQVRDLTGNISTLSDTITLQTAPSGNASFFDDFNRTAIGSNWSIARGTWSISSSRLYHSATLEGAIVLNAPLSGNNYDAQASFELTDLVGGNARGVILRYQNVNNYYVGYYHRGSLKHRIVKVVNGTATTLVERVAPGVANYTYHQIRFSAEGPTLKYYFDGVLLLQAADATFGAGKVGIYSKVYYHRFDDFRVTIISSDPPPTVAVDPVSSPTKQIQITLSGTKSVASSVYLNGSQIVPFGNETTWSAAAPLNAEGLNTLSVTARNSSGLESAPVVITVTRDTAPPQIQFSSPAPNAYVNQPQTLVYGTVDGSEFSMVAELDEGANVVTKTAVDAAGNEATASLSLILDTVPPSIEVVSPSSDAWVSVPEVTVHYDCEDESTVCSSHEITLELEHEGANELTVVHTDLAGNVGLARHVVRLDTIAPEIIFTTHADGQRLRSNLEIIGYSIDGQSGSILFPLANEGENICQIVAEDPAGNFTVASLALIRDTTPPSFAVSFPEQGHYINRAQVVLP